MKKRKFLCSLTTLVSILSVMSLPLLAQAGEGYERVFIFGDSLSDSGNVYAVLGETAKAPYEAIPSAPYAIGGHHFSNGKTWSERLAQSLSLNADGKAAISKPGKFGNYAFGGARVLADPNARVPNSTTQIYIYLGDHGAANPNALYVYQFGGNDIRDALGLLPNFGAAQAHVAGAAAKAAADIAFLYSVGARHILVANAPDLRHAPAIQGFPGLPAAAGALSAIFNGVLDAQLAGVEGAHPDLKISRLDLYGFINEVVANGAAFGLTNVTSPCLFYFADGDNRCQNPEEFLFWDGIHPTAVVHTAIAARAATVLSNP